jgi:tRNA-binding EMAP/Myf-like protein
MRNDERIVITIDDFKKVNTRVGTIISACLNEKAKKPAYKLTSDFGDEIGIKTSASTSRRTSASAASVSGLSSPQGNGRQG